MAFHKKEIQDKMQHAFEHLQSEFNALRTSRVNPSMLDHVKVDAYGSEMQLKALATVSVQDRQLVVSPFDPSLAASISKAIQQTNMGLNPILERNVIRVPVPPLSEDLRKVIAKDAKDKAEKAKVVVREVRRKGNDLIRDAKQKGDLTEDLQKKSEKEVQLLTDEYCEKIDKLFVQKEKEILTV
ncbi:MAG: ribosome recycling factor [Chlamydiae bacterium RIFCSPHIGHO2_12_FULL_49_11]|nr:MAG: ribosome recycling factor [Chlamydiae bacterium RIFCSPHIGHO2_12_FULL_49_11]